MTGPQREQPARSSATEKKQPETNDTLFEGLGNAVADKSTQHKNGSDKNGHSITANETGGPGPCSLVSADGKVEHNTGQEREAQQMLDSSEKQTGGSEPPGDTVIANPRSKWTSRFLSFLDDQWFLIGMALTIAIASQVQVPQSRQRVKSTVVSYLFVSIIFFATGCTLDTNILIRNYARWKSHLWVQGQSFLMCSAIMFGIVSAAATDQSFMDPGLLIGMILLDCIPTTIASNVVMTGQAKGNQELTVVETSIGNFIGVFLSPALVIMYLSVPAWYTEVLPVGNDGNFTGIYRRVLMQLGLSIYLPLFLGQVVRYFFPQTCHAIFKKNPVFRRIGSICMLMIQWSTYDQAFSVGAFGTVPTSNLVFVVFISLGTWLLWSCISFGSSIIWLSKPDVVSVTYCVAAKGLAIGVPLSNTIFTGLDTELLSKIQIPIVIYLAIQVAFGSILIVFFRKWIERDLKKQQEERDNV